MMIEILGGERHDRVLVTMEADELDGYGVTFSAMSLCDPPTRALLNDLLSMVTRMGIRGQGEQVQVDCVQTGKGGCALLISKVTEHEYHFGSSDDIIHAYLAGALPDGTVERMEDGWRFRPYGTVSRGQMRMLNEFCVRPSGNSPGQAQ